MERIKKRIKEARDEYKNKRLNLLNTISEAKRNGYFSTNGFEEFIDKCYEVISPQLWKALKLNEEDGAPKV